MKSKCIGQAYRAKEARAGDEVAESFEAVRSELVAADRAVAGTDSFWFGAINSLIIIVREGLESCNEATEDEEDQLDLAPGLTPQSRLACQCVPDGSHDLVVEIPGWNRNLVKEDH